MFHPLAIPSHNRHTNSLNLITTCDLLRLSSTGNAKGHANVKMALARRCSAMHVSPTEHAFARAKMHTKREGVQICTSSLLQCITVHVRERVRNNNILLKECCLGGRCICICVICWRNKNLHAICIHCSLCK